MVCVCVLLADCWMDVSVCSSLWIVGSGVVETSMFPTYV